MGIFIFLCAVSGMALIYSMYIFNQYSKTTVLVRKFINNTDVSNIDFDKVVVDIKKSTKTVLSNKTIIKTVKDLDEYLGSDLIYTQLCCKWASKNA